MDNPDAHLAYAIPAVIAGVLTWLICQQWHDHIYQRWSAAFTANDFNARSIGNPLAYAVPDPSYPWPAAHALLTALAVVAALLVIGRMLLHLVRVEHHLA